ncbi:MAG: tetratricopeptide repeat protein [Alphaproteobacteria bacterium]|nr:tetratricopeptide repeat protein [Alphaproteobacteria bacterium]
MADHTEDALIREVDDELREEQMRLLWQRYGGLVVGAAILLVVVVAGYQAWRQYDVSNRMAEGERFHAAMTLADTGDVTGAKAALAALTSDASSGYGLLAEFKQAALLADGGDAAGAAALYQKIARDAAGNAPLSGLAGILGALIEINAGGYDPKSMEFRLSTLADDTHPYRHTARELLALVALDAGETDKARGLFETLSADAQAPAGLRERAQKLLQQIGG